jgi:sugar-phosphatase
MDVVQALILDMDGVLIDSEPLWRRAMIAGFAEFNIHLTEQDCRLTVGKRIDGVIAIWLDKTNSPANPLKVEQVIVNHLLELIELEGMAMPGAIEGLKLTRQVGVLTGLATSSSETLMDAVLTKLQARDLFQVVVSAEKMKYAKPHPMVFLECAALMGVPPANCLVVEDSVNGVIAGKAAGMKVIAVPDHQALQKDKFAIADIVLNGMHQLPEYLADTLKNMQITN